ncbi:MAG TPA: hypothetical protein VEH06_04900, partial [Candidatus Bathyarchaeia archaeon]|nr:hypothetical protein [Candidatus Bathyarchaeia archaeon]
MNQQNDAIDTKHLTTTETDTINYGKTNSVEKSHPRVIDVDKAIIVSDLHLGYEKCNTTALIDFLAENIS